MGIENLKKLLKCAVDDFRNCALKARISLKSGDIRHEVLPNPHVPPSSLPSGYMAAYIFFWDSKCLKVGKVGPLSSSRYTSQHYNPGSSKSNLAASLLKHKDDLGLPDITDEDVGKWIKQETTRVNFLLSSKFGMPAFSFLESFLQCRFGPRFG